MKKVILSFLTLVLLASISSCIKDKFDAPPANGVDPALKVNFSIDSLKARYVGQNYAITEDLVISAVVVGDDKSGNLYKQLAIEDSTGGITLLLGGSYAYNNYPVGRRLFIKLKGLWVTKYNGLYQIAAYFNVDGSTGGIPTSLYNKYIFPGKWNLPVIPHVVTISQLGDKYQSELIELDNVEFSSADAGKPYADGYNQRSLARIIKDCSGHTVEVYTSGYSDFANLKTPTGNGKLLAIYSVYGANAQLIVRDTSDVQLYGTNCNGGHVTGNGIMAIRNAYAGSDVTLANGTSLTGIVISDSSHLNTDPKNAVIQDSTGGIVVRFSATHNFKTGDKVTIDLSGQTLTSYNGLLEITPVPNANATKIGTGTITPRTATISQINANSNLWESTLLTVQAATISGSPATYSGSKTLTDATGTLTLYTRSQATFASTNYPTGTVSVTGVLGTFNTPQLSIRTTSDVQ